MGNEHAPKPQNDPEDLNLVHIYDAAKRVFDDIEIIPEEDYQDIEGTPVPLFDNDVSTPKLDTTLSKPKSLLEKREEEYDKLWAEYENSKDSKLLKKADKIKEEIFWLQENNPDKPKRKPSK